jgi:predicted nicotinamide N-methyase
MTTSTAMIDKLDHKLDHQQQTNTKDDRHRSKKNKKKQKKVPSPETVVDRRDSSIQCLCFQDVMKSYQQQQLEEEGGEDHQAAAAHVFFELANAPMVSYKIDNNDDNDKYSSFEKTTIRIHQDHADACGQHTGGIVWETSFLLLNYLRQIHLFSSREEEEEGISNRNKKNSKNKKQKNKPQNYPCGKTVVEVGAGCGLLGLGIYHSKLAEQVILTETDSVLPNLQRNVLQNNDNSGNSGNKISNDKLRACVLDWTRYQEDCRQDACQIEPHSVDMIVGTDVVFSMRFVGPLLETLRYLAHSDTTILLCLQERCPDAHRLLLETANDHNLEVCDISKQVTEVPTCEWGRDLDCCVLQLKVMNNDPSNTTTTSRRTKKRKLGSS